MPLAGAPGVVNVTPYWQPSRGGGGGGGGSSGGGGGGGQISGSQATNQQQSTGQQQSSTYIPEYSQTPILNEIAQYSRSMAPQVYQWGMDQFNKNQGNIDALMRNALSYASPQRVASEMGMAESGVMQGAEAGRQNAIRDLQSYGIDPSSGRYAALDKASQVMAGATAAGAGNQQRMATEAQGSAMQNQALSASMQNTQTGFNAANAMKGLLDTGMSLKYPPLGTTSSGDTQSTGSGSTQSFSMPANSGGFYGIPGMFATGGAVGYQDGGALLAGNGGEDEDSTTGGFVSQELSPSNGSQVDDVQARLNAGEFVIPKDVSAWLGQEYFYKLMAKARAARATAGQESGMSPPAEQSTGYGADNYASA